MKPYLHARISAKTHGGVPADYQDIHDFIDGTKAAHPDVRHRAILHNAYGCFIVERVFGTTRINSDGKEYSTRDIAEEHIIQDVGFLPTISDYLQHMTTQEWFGGGAKRNKTVLEPKLPSLDPKPYNIIPDIPNPWFQPYRPWTQEPYTLQEKVID